jgi:RecB family exonuclease
MLAGEHLGESMAGLRMSITDFNGIVGEVGEMYRRFRRISSEGFMAAEDPIEAEAGDSILLRGRIDAVFDNGAGTRIVDWKTGSFLDDAAPQLDFYALAWKLVHGVPPVSAEATSLATGEQMQRHPDEVSVAATMREIGAMVAAIRHAVETMTELERTAGPHCTWCPLLDDCSEGRAAVAILS